MRLDGERVREKKKVHGLYSAQALVARDQIFTALHEARNVEDLREVLLFMLERIAIK